MPASIEEQMRGKGYVKVEGVAILNDVAITETKTGVLVPNLVTEASVKAFNAERGGGWTLYRKEFIAFDTMAVFQ
jgi:hypothetical protein